MRATLYLRIASLLTLLHALLHTIGGVFGKPSKGAAMAAFTAMQSHRFLVMGHTRSYAAFYVGLGLAVSLFLTVEAVVFWMLGSLARTAGPQLRPILWAFLLAYLVLAINSWIYFFFGPVIVEILIAACLGRAIYELTPRLRPA